MTKQHVNGYCPHCNEPATLEAHEIDQCNECGRYYHSNDLARRRLLNEAAPDLLEALRRLVDACDHEKISGSQVTNARAAITKAEEG